MLFLRHVTTRNQRTAQRRAVYSCIKDSAQRVQPTSRSHEGARIRLPGVAKHGTVLLAAIFAFNDTASVQGVHSLQADVNYLYSTGRIHLRPNTFLPRTESRIVARFWERFFRGSGGSADSFSLIC